ncbi:MAG: hypothetical protein ACLTFB_00935 [Candidatus Phytoplasma pyri]
MFKKVKINYLMLILLSFLLIIISNLNIKAKEFNFLDLDAKDFKKRDNTFESLQVSVIKPLKYIKINEFEIWPLYASDDNVNEIKIRIFLIWNGYKEINISIFRDKIFFKSTIGIHELILKNEFIKYFNDNKVQINKEITEFEYNELLEIFNGENKIIINDKYLKNSLTETVQLDTEEIKSFTQQVENNTKIANESNERVNKTSEKVKEAKSYLQMFYDLFGDYELLAATLFGIVIFLFFVMFIYMFIKRFYQLL